ncbi:unnamed protein product [Schistosoma margrebowiei]|uniref:Uncharacterized protein n=1 Tax=Schistosoma margrebowiei TaxID=48269 RepID=A0A3P7YEW1_9TREM|nr:unnamed protein product [Schistosoma margrebowiei]
MRPHSHVPDNSTHHLHHLRTRRQSYVQISRPRHP